MRINGNDLPICETINTAVDQLVSDLCPDSLSAVYLSGVALFVGHFMLANPEALRRKKVVRFLVPMALLWPLTYLISAPGSLAHSWAATHPQQTK